MTMQFRDLTVQRSGKGWTITRGPRGGNRHVHVLDEQGETLCSINLASSLEDFSRFAHGTTAGMRWDQQMLAYLTELQEQHYFVIRAWWGARLVISLEELHSVSSQELADDLHQIECNLVLTGLHQLVSETENGDEPNYDRSTDALECTICTLAHFPGLLQLREAIPLLQVLEERLSVSNEIWGEFNYHECLVRRLIQISLRRLGEKPRCYPVITFLKDQQRRKERAALCRKQKEPIEGRRRHTRLSQLKKSTPLTEVYRLLGAPDYIEWRDEGTYWRYDVDAVEPYTLLLELSEDDTVASMVRYMPSFWVGPQVFPSRNFSLIDYDGSVVVSAAHQLYDGTFIGHRIELDVLQEIESSELAPQADLARLLFEGDRSAIYPLADALEDAEDARASQVRSWFSSDDSQTELDQKP